jgi:predicted DNA-binding transcriptional regulator YafY
MFKSKIEIKSVVVERALSWQTAVNQQIEEDITELKEMGEPIYYSKNGKLICEHADGRKFEYRYLADGSQESIAEIID